VLVGTQNLAAGLLVNFLFILVYLHVSQATFNKISQLIVCNWKLFLRVTEFTIIKHIFCKQNTERGRVDLIIVQVIHIF
jgi:hypothetical protein